MNRKSLSIATILASVGLLAQARGDILNSAQNFAVLGASTVTNTGATIVTGDLGVWTGTAITGFPPGIVIGTIRAGDPIAQAAQGDLTTAYNALTAMVPTQTLTGVDLGGMTLTPGVYVFATSAALTGTLTLNALGDPNATFVFQMGSTLTTAIGSSVVTINSANGNNVYWKVGSSATIGGNTAFQGNILALASITMNTGATILNGRALARTGAVTLASNTITAHATAACYANCDNSSIAPILNVNDFQCFINAYAAGSSLPQAQQVAHYANCDHSSNPPALNVNDFQCFINKFAAGCP